jgi:nicotinate-nucleotide pyrophosphorylase (carboxylating)
VVNENIDALIELALAEDLGDGDHTTLATIPADTAGAARLLVKQPGVLAGVELAQAVMRRVDPALNVKVFIQDGAQVVPGDVAFTVMGASRSILIAERTVLNFMQRMSGIATLTRRFVQAMEGTRCRVLDTRKTTPGLRHVEKWAVRIGGGLNHRMGLYDMVMIKDNHADMAGGISRAIAAVKAYQHQLGRELPIEVEVRNMKELEEVLITGGVDRIMLDNFGLDDLRLAVKRVRRRMATEASGGITLENAHDYAATGVDYISVGALTHSVGSLDLSLKAM